MKKIDKYLHKYYTILHILQYTAETLVEKHWLKYDKTERLVIPPPEILHYFNTKNFLHYNIECILYLCAVYIVQ